jgi:hypothetical protein
MKTCLLTLLSRKLGENGKLFPHAGTPFLRPHLISWNLLFDVDR